MMRVVVNGAAGRMGAEVIRLVNEGNRDSTLSGATDRGGSGYPTLSEFSGGCDVVIDFSNHLATEEMCDFIVRHSVPAVIATTGQTEGELAMIDEAARHVPIFRAGNMSVGVALLIELAKKTAAVMPDADIEIIERHHNRKEDAPSGTALMIADAIRDVRGGAEYKLGRAGHERRTPGEIGINAVRAGGIVGVHEVLVCTDTQSITLKHEAYSRSLFAEGALEAARYLLTVTSPGIYNMYDMLREDR